MSVSSQITKRRLLITHLHYLLLTCAFSSALQSHTAAHHSSFDWLVGLTDWLPVCLSVCLLCSWQRPWASSWPAAVPHPDIASSRSCPGCASTAATLTCATAPPPGTRLVHSTASAHCCCACGCWGRGCEKMLVAIAVDLRGCFLPFDFTLFYFCTSNL